MITNIREQLLRDEGRELTVYLDTLGNLTVGVGCRTDLPLGTIITDEQCDQLFDEALNNVNIALDAHLPWWKHLDDTRQGVLQNLCFNLGINGLMRFTKMLNAIQLEHWTIASYELINSKAYDQEKERISRLAAQLESGTWH